MLRHSRLSEDKRSEHGGANNKQTDDLWGGPGVDLSATKGESQQRHQDPGQKCHEPIPINGFQTRPETSLLMLHLEKEEDHDEGRSTNGQIDPNWYKSVHGR